MSNHRPDPIVRIETAVVSGFLLLQFLRNRLVRILNFGVFCLGEEIKKCIIRLLIKSNDALSHYRSNLVIACFSF